MVSLNASTEPQGDLGPQPWLSAASTRAVMAALAADGTEVRFVGGCVRDGLAKRPVKDIDIATPDEPETVIELLGRAGIRVVPTGLDHGTVTAVFDDRSFEITTLRRDEETDGRHAKVAFTDDWIADAERRDFTINAMSATPDGAIYDYNNGIAHLAHGRVRFIGRAETRIDEDYLRILRFFRFHGGYGLPPLDRAAMTACRARTAKLAELSGERVRDELLKILMVPNPAEILVPMQSTGVLEVILPEAGDVAPLRMLNWLETRAINIAGVAPDPLRHLAALLDTQHPESALSLMPQRLRLSNAARARLTDMVVPTIEVTANMDKTDEHRAIRRLGPDLARDLALLAWARELAASSRLPRTRTEAYIELLELCVRWRAPEFPLSGADVLALGVAEGPDIGALLERVEDWWENGDYKADRQQCLDRLVKEAGDK
ncbi:MAG: CCA tRNA nucleotidyltransferase [Rhodospirillaceae bacterium]|jgi:poly(A) polymerase|nr:CCA tRNA nucleotidyltransferase [Rhodospirillaceae bacterium]